MFRLRSIYLLLGSALVLMALFVTDPDKGLSTGMLLGGLAIGVLAVAFAHVSRKALHDYPEADMLRLFTKAQESPTGAGLGLIALAIVFAALLLLFSGRLHAQDVHTYIPRGAQLYAPQLATEQQRLWPDHPAPETLAGLVEQESCLSLTHPRCWNPASRLKTSREEGAGMGQITRAWRPNGTLWFDSLADMRTRHPELQGWAWSNVYTRADLQLRAIVLMSRDNYWALRRVVTDPLAAITFTDAAYNGGLGGVQSERRACGLKAGCDPQQWFGHVEHTCTKSRAALYGNRSACDINREHVHLVMRVRSSKYAPFFQPTVRPELVEGPT